MNTNRVFLSELATVFLLVSCVAAQSQINTGSNGSDGAFNPTTNIVVDMSDYPGGIYQYTSVNIPSRVSVSFIPNINNAPVIWLVQSNVVISGTVSVAGQNGTDSAGGAGGPGGYSGGASGRPVQGPGAGPACIGRGGNASYATGGILCDCAGLPGGNVGGTYGNSFLIPLLGGSGGGGGGSSSYSGGGGGGAIVIVSSVPIQLNGTVNARGGCGWINVLNGGVYGGGGSGGGVRFVASTIVGSGSITAFGGAAPCGQAGNGWIRFDTYLNNFSGILDGSFSQGSQFVVVPTNGSGSQISIMSVAGVSISASPTGFLTTPDTVISAMQTNPIPIVVHCAQIPLNTAIAVCVTPMSGSPVTVTGYNTNGTQTSSTATVLINMPRGGGLISATAAMGN